MTSRRCNCIWRASVVALGILFIIFGVYLYLKWIDIFTRLRGKEMALSPKSPAFSSWKVSPLPLNFDVYLFNWTNPQDFYKGSNIKPRFEQLGPYRFREHPDKVDIEWHPHNYSVSFRKKSIFYFDAEGSHGKLTDKITTVNTVAHAAALHLKDLSGWQKGAVKLGLTMSKQGLTVTKTADEWIFTGYSDQLVNAARGLSIIIKDIKVPYDRVGWMYTRNNSADFDGHFNIHTGADDISKMGQIHTWNYMTHNGAFKDECGLVKGSMGEFFPPNLSTNDTITMYLQNLCRAIPLDYTETVKVHGVKAYKFSGGERSVDNGTLYPETKCFCVNDECQPAGVINIAPCKYNSSVFMSYPHFYKADPSYLEAIEGLKPEREKHEFFMTLEPNAGVPMDVGGGFQANYLLEPVPGITTFENIPRTFIPIMWCEERVRVTPEIAKEISLVPLIVLLGQIVTAVLLASGLILTGWFPATFITKLCKDPKTKSKAFELNPLSSSRIVSMSMAQLKRPLENLVLLDYKNDFMRRPNGSVTEGLMGTTLKMKHDDVITR